MVQEVGCRVSAVLLDQIELQLDIVPRSRVVGLEV